MGVEYTPWLPQFNDLVLYQAGDRALAEAAADQAVRAEADDDTQFAVDLANLYALRGLIFNHPALSAIARSSAHIERQTIDATWINPARMAETWPLDMARILLADWKDNQ